jgi:hypothetical protein
VPRDAPLWNAPIHHPSVGRKLSVPFGVLLPNGNRALVFVSTGGMDCAKQQGDGAPAHLCCAMKGAAAQGRSSTIHYGANYATKKFS